MKASRLLPWFAASFFCIACVLSLASQLSAQSTTDGAVGGTVVDSSGAAVPNAKITAKNNGTNAIASATTDDTGYFRIGKLAPAEYTVTIDATGFAPFTADHVTVLIGSITDLTAKLNVASAGAVVEVSAEIPVINTTSQEFSNVVSESAISNLPINNGRWSSFALLTPGAVNDGNGFGLISFRGISPLLNNSTVDGGDNNQAFFSEERASKHFELLRRIRPRCRCCHQHRHQKRLQPVPRRRLFLRSRQRMGRHESLHHAHDATGRWWFRHEPVQAQRRPQNLWLRRRWPRRQRQSLLLHRLRPLRQGLPGHRKGKRPHCIFCGARRRFIDSRRLLRDPDSGFLGSKFFRPSQRTDCDAGSMLAFQ